MQSGSFWAYSDAAPLEARPGGEPDDDVPGGPTQRTRCRACGAFLTRAPTSEGDAEREQEWTCQRCGHSHDTREMFR